jgi:hypothetical protein
MSKGLAGVRMSRRRWLVAAAASWGLGAASPAWGAPDAGMLAAMLATIDDRTTNSGDWQSAAYIERKEQGKSDLVYQAAIYRRDADDKLAILFTLPAAEAGKGYLRLEGNLFFYDPTVGKWERRTERERIGGTDSNRQDFDQSRLSAEYDAAYVAEEMLGKFPVHHLKLAAKAGVDVAYPVVELWIDKASGNVLKRQDFALSLRLMRTTYYPSWQKLFSSSKKADVYFAKEVLIYDEVVKGNQTRVVIQSVVLDPLDPNIFTKAWMESKSR